MDISPPPIPPPALYPRWPLNRPVLSTLPRRAFRALRTLTPSIATEGKQSACTFLNRRPRHNLPTGPIPFLWLVALLRSHRLRAVISIPSRCQHRLRRVDRSATLPKSTRDPATPSIRHRWSRYRRAPRLTPSRTTPGDNQSAARCRTRLSTPSRHIKAPACMTTGATRTQTTRMLVIVSTRRSSRRSSDRCTRHTHRSLRETARHMPLTDIPILLWPPPPITRPGALTRCVHAQLWSTSVPPFFPLIVSSSRSRILSAAVASRSRITV